MQSEIYLKWESPLPGNYRYLALLLTYWFIVLVTSLFTFLHLASDCLTLLLFVYFLSPDLEYVW